MQPDGMWSEPPKSTAREEDEQREVRRTFKILREVWLNIGVDPQRGNSKSALK